MKTRLRYELIGFTVWHGAKWYLRRRFGAWPRRLAIGTLVVGGIAAFAIAQHREES